jgi:hypothetical protein
MPSFKKVKLDNKDMIIDFLDSQLKDRKERYENLFKFSNFLSKGIKEDHPLGSCIKDSKGLIQGYIGCFAHRSPYHKNNWILNMTEWVVSSKYRAYSLKLLQHFLKDNSLIFTNFSASVNVQKILPRFGFQVIDEGINYYSVLSNMNFNILSTKLMMGKKAQEIFKNTKHEKLIDEHIKLGGILISSANGRGYIFFKKKMRFFGILNLIHTINFNNEDFSRDWSEICKIALINFFSNIIKIDCRFSPKGIIPKKNKKRKMFVRGLNYNGIIPSRAFSEPLQSIGDIECF